MVVTAVFWRSSYRITEVCVCLQEWVRRMGAQTTWECNSSDTGCRWHRVIKLIEVPASAHSSTHRVLGPVFILPPSLHPFVVFTQYCKKYDLLGKDDKQNNHLTENPWYKWQKDDQELRGRGSYPPCPDGPSSAWTQVEEWTTDSEAAKGKHHFHHGHQDKRHPQDNCCTLVDKTAQNFE